MRADHPKAIASDQECISSIRIMDCFFSAATSRFGLQTDLSILLPVLLSPEEIDGYV